MEGKGNLIFLFSADLIYVEGLLQGVMKPGWMLGRWIGLSLEVPSNWKYYTLCILLYSIPQTPPKASSDRRHLLMYGVLNSGAEREIVLGELFFCLVENVLSDSRDQAAGPRKQFFLHIESMSCCSRLCLLILWTCPCPDEDRPPIEKCK